MFFKSIAWIVCYLFVFNTQAQNDTVYTSAWEKIIPSVALPSTVQPQRSNNNIDAIQFGNKYFVVFRTAPTHFASIETKLYIMSTSDFEHWEYEHEIILGSDMREPRFVLYKDTLRLFFFQGGTEPLKFEPQHIFTLTYDSTAKKWSGLQNIQLDGYVPWRLRVRDSTLYLSAYYGKDLYNDAHHADLRLFHSDDGYHFEAISTAPQDTTLGAEEGEFIFDHHGNLWANIRLEGSGSLLCYADKDSLENWHKKFSRFKYDSAIMFEQAGDIYMISRRNLNGEATKTKVPTPFQRKVNLLKYSLSGKSTCLFKLDTMNMEWKALLDFPSTGDTAFPAIVPAEENAFHVLNYSSDINKKEKVWLIGQLKPTYIYHAILYFNK